MSDSTEESYDDGDLVVRKVFYITVISTVTFCTVVFAFIL